MTDPTGNALREIVASNARHDMNEAVRKALESAAVAIENKSGNELYRQAWKIAARVVRSLKPD